MEVPESDRGARVDCDGCATTNRAGARFCRRCGRALSVDGPRPEGLVAQPGEARAPLSGESEPPWPVVVSVLGFAGLLLGSSVVGMIAARWLDAAQASVELALTVFDAGVVAAYAWVYRGILVRLVGRFDVGRSLVEAVLTGLVLGAFALAYFGVLAHLGFDAPNIVEPYRAVGWPTWSAFLLVSIAPGLVEEVAFRGIVMGRLLRAVSARESLLIQAALFSALHLSPMVFPSHFVIGLLLGRLRARTRSLYPGMVVHAAYNAVILARDVWWR